MLLLSLLTAIVAAEATTKNVGVVNLRFQTPSDHSRFDKRDENTGIHARALNFEKREENGTLLAELKNEGQWYSVPMKFGSQQDEVLVLVDTGSSDLWISGSDNAYCRSNRATGSSSRTAAARVLPRKNLVQLPQVNKYRVIDDKDVFHQVQNNEFPTPSVHEKAIVPSVPAASATLDCSLYGTFDSGASDTFQSNSTPFFILYADETYALGEWGQDTAFLHDLEIRNLNFAVANQSDSIMGVLGIGLEGLESTNVGALIEDYHEPFTYANFPTKLVEDGLINRRVYSLYLDSEDADSGSVLFGGIDHAKYNGTLQLVPLINTYYGTLPSPIRFEITVTNITVSSDEESVGLLNSEYFANLDSGTTYTYVPYRLLTAIGRSFGMTYSYSQGVYYRTCPSSSLLDTLHITFNFQGVEIKIPLADFLLRDSTSNNCILTMLESDDGIILGGNFLRAAYVVYDLDNLQLGLAQARYTTEEDIEVVESDIPRAVSVEDWDNTLDVEGLFSSFSEYNATATATRSSALTSAARSASATVSGSAAASRTSSRTTATSRSVGDASNLQAYGLSGLLVALVMMI